MLDFDLWIIGVAEAVSRRADCWRRQVGAVVVRDGRIIGTGYNHSSLDGKSCLNGDCPRWGSTVPPGSDYDSGPGYCIAIHAEAAALLDTPRELLAGSDMYVTSEPCNGCVKLITASHISTIKWPGKRD